VLMQFVSTGYKIHPTGYYAPPSYYTLMHIFLLWMLCEQFAYD
jgi:hypothetical protein